VLELPFDNDYRYRAVVHGYFDQQAGSATLLIKLQMRNDEQFETV